MGDQYKSVHVKNRRLVAARQRQRRARCSTIKAPDAVQLHHSALHTDDTVLVVTDKGMGRHGANDR